MLSLKLVWNNRTYETKKLKFILEHMQIKQNCVIHLCIKPCQVQKRQKKICPKMQETKIVLGGGGGVFSVSSRTAIAKFGVTPEHKGNLEWENKDLQVVS